MSSIALSYSQVEQRPSFTQEVKEAVKLAREQGFGQQTGQNILIALNLVDSFRVLLCGEKNCWS